ncbi:MAG TPA: hypothetical protein VLU99_05230 [Nitrososphaerales archaeon]|nr:hypothetical protein [Nitrososphaerales archaeon]
MGAADGAMGGRGAIGGGGAAPIGLGGIGGGGAPGLGAGGRVLADGAAGMVAGEPATPTEPGLGGVGIAFFC